MMRLAIAADMPALVNVPATAATGISGICRVPSWRIKPKGLLLGRLRLLRLLRLLWLLSSARAWVCRWTTLGIAILQLAATNASESIAEETCLVNIAELIVLPSLQRDQAAQTAMSGIGNFGPPFLHSSCWLSGISITWHFFVWPWGVWQPAPHPATQSNLTNSVSPWSAGAEGVAGASSFEGPRKWPAASSARLVRARVSNTKHFRLQGMATHWDEWHRHSGPNNKLLEQIVVASHLMGMVTVPFNPSNLVFTAISLAAPPTIRSRKACFARTFCVKQTDASRRNVTTNPWKHIKMKQLLLVIEAPWPHLTFC